MIYTQIDLHYTQSGLTESNKDKVKCNNIVGVNTLSNSGESIAVQISSSLPTSDTSIECLYDNIDGSSLRQSAVTVIGRL